ncbi:hypothetical protein FACS1894133_3000 [Clostridia bacterium]|nr:hypothetical protein FACS1894133_3000 [Clostridia bacterium]
MVGTATVVRRRSPAKIIIPVVAVVLLAAIAAGVVLFVLPMFGKGGGKYIPLSDKSVYSYYISKGDYEGLNSLSSRQTSDDGSVIVGITGYDTGKRSGTLTVFDNAGNRTNIADGVSDNYILSGSGSTVVYTANRDDATELGTVTRYDIANKKPETVSENARSVGLSYDGKSVAFTNAPAADITYTVTVKTGEKTVSVNNVTQVSNISDDGAYIYYTGEIDSGYYFYVYHGDDKTKLATVGYQFGEYEIFYNKSGTQAVYTENTGSGDKVCISVNGNKTELTDGHIENFARPKYTVDSNIFTEDFRDTVIHTGGSYDYGTLYSINGAYECDVIAEDVLNNISPQLSADGTAVLYRESGDKLTKSIVGKSGKPKVIGEDVLTYDASADLNSIYYVNRDKELYYTGGGDPTKISDDVYAQSYDSDGYSRTLVLSDKNVLFFLADYSRNNEVSTLYASERGGKRTKIADGAKGLLYIYPLVAYALDDMDIEGTPYMISEGGTEFKQVAPQISEEQKKQSGITDLNATAAKIKDTVEIAIGELASSGYAVADGTLLLKDGKFTGTSGTEILYDGTYDNDGVKAVAALATDLPKTAVARITLEKGNTVGGSYSIVTGVVYADTAEHNTVELAGYYPTTLRDSAGSYTAPAVDTDISHYDDPARVAKENNAVAAKINDAVEVALADLYSRDIPADDGIILLKDGKIISIGVEALYGDETYGTRSVAALLSGLPKTAVAMIGIQNGEVLAIVYADTNENNTTEKAGYFPESLRNDARGDVAVDAASVAAAIEEQREYEDATTAEDDTTSGDEPDGGTTARADDLSGEPDSAKREHEPNGPLYSNAEPIEIGTAYVANLYAVYDTEKDWFKFTVKQAGTYSVGFSAKANNSGEKYWDFYLYNEKQAVEISKNFDNDNGWLFHKYINGNDGHAYTSLHLTEGTYYIRVESSSRWSDEDYAFMVTEG